MENITPQSSNVYFFLWAAVLIFFMKAGFILIEIGQIRRKNVGVHMTLKFLDMSVVLIVYLFLGYAVSYGMQFLGGELTPGGTDVGSYAHFMKMVMFAVATVTIVTGAVAERIKISGYVVAVIIISSIIYPIGENLAWGASGALTAIGFHDFAGSGVVHLVGGVLGLTAAIVLGARNGRFKNGKPLPIPGHDITYIVLGAFILAFGWYGFNIGSAAFISEKGASIASVAVATTMAIAGGTLGAAVMTKGDPIWCANGMCAGLVAVCAGADLFTPVSGLIEGSVAGAQTPLIFRFIEERGIDDVCGVTPVHAVSGLWGVITAGIFIAKVSLIGQIIGAVALVAVASTSAFAIDSALNVIGLLRVSEDAAL
ncbi:MAG: hypothetical protein SCH39_10045 [Methanosarcinales archaeon]|nr:hypothetical protein [Methanosarcinales archaeon]